MPRKNDLAVSFVFLSLVDPIIDVVVSFFILAGLEWRIYKLYILASGLTLWVGILLVLCVYRGTSFASDFWLKIVSPLICVVFSDKE